MENRVNVSVVISVFDEEGKSILKELDKNYEIFFRWHEG